MPLRRVMPNWGRLELSAIILAWVLKAVELFLILKISGISASPITLLALAATRLLDLVILILIVVIFIRIVLSWIAPQGDNPVVPLLYQLSAPVLNPARQLIPPIGGLDLSPMLALIVAAAGPHAGGAAADRSRRPVVTPSHRGVTS